ncbi:ferredoxin-type protein NapF [Hydrogenimonas cancrithermarum]|uniref:Nitrate reductase n=1 Tax=Hydrogenimonas cancrithermarum TaxID=2993563 RepID=A0ABM8FMW3_9BACT|nr:ferredoxin-type protein NapF [Hydrogenimonas cancrithermarum]BDY13631.1 nitrate reductase [Hydrogenimonas cancrithermarum]
MTDPKRRGVFASLSSAIKGKKERERPIVRPPYNNDANLFLKLCPECIEKPCAKVCEEDIIHIRDDGTPELSFQKRGCTFCDACLSACEANVLSDKTVNYIDAKVEIDVLKCIAWHQVMCSSCKDPCLEDAIVFLGLFRPEINMEKCTACSWCLSVCPTEAIEITSVNQR